MKLFAPIAAVLLVTSAAFAQGQNDQNHWDKSYTLSGQPTLVLKTGDSNLNIKSCGSCQAVRISVDSPKRKLSDFVLEEDQSGNTVHFSLKEKAHLGGHITVRVNWHDSPVNVTVETPVNLNLHAETEDGNLNANGLNGAINLRSSDGRQTIADVSGVLRVEASDGDVDMRDIAGTLDARTSDGTLNIAGKLDGWNVTTSDGKVNLELAGGSILKNDSSLRSSDGTVTVKLPKDLAANLDISTSDGKIDCNLPLTLDGFHSKGGSDHSVRGKLNAGGPTLTIHTSDGTVHLSSI